MNRWKTVVVFGLAALVAGGGGLVYARGTKAGGPQASQSTLLAASSERLPDPPKDGSTQSTNSPQVIYDLSTLPDPVQRMLSKIISAAQTGNLEAMRAVLESNELKPMVAAAHVDDPIQYWKKQSANGTGRDVLAAMLNIIASGAVLTGKGHDAIYVWPYFAKADIAKLTPPQQVEFYRVVPPKKAEAIVKTGKYDFYRLGISPAGVWHYFIR
jgi:hypothetical protein